MLDVAVDPLVGSSASRSSDCRLATVCEVSAGAVLLPAAASAITAAGSAGVVVPASAVAVEVELVSLVDAEPFAGAVVVASATVDDEPLVLVPVLLDPELPAGDVVASATLDDEPPLAGVVVAPVEEEADVSVDPAGVELPPVTGVVEPEPAEAGAVVEPVVSSACS